MFSKHQVPYVVWFLFSSVWFFSIFQVHASSGTAGTAQYGRKQIEITVIQIQKGGFQPSSSLLISKNRKKDYETRPKYKEKREVTCMYI